MDEDEAMREFDEYCERMEQAQKEWYDNLEW